MVFAHLSSYVLLYTGDDKIPQNIFEIMGTENACPRSGEGGQASITGDYKEQDSYNFWIEYIILQRKYKL